MSGLDKIISEIALEAKAAAEKIISEANDNAERIITKAQEQATEIEAAASDTAEREYKKIISRGRSTGEVNTGRAILLEKQKIITDVISKAQSSILNMDKNKYFEFLTKLLLKYAENTEGEIILSKKDKAAITEPFKKAVSDKKLTISETNGDFEGGFILVYGDIEENCSITALIEDERDKLHDAVSSYLFQ